MWTDLALKVLVALATRLLTEKFLGRGIVRIARVLADSTDNSLDDGLVDDFAQALGQDDLVKKPARVNS